MNQDEGIPSWQETLGSKGLETGRPISSAIEIAVAPEVVWKGLATPGNLKRCHPFCDSTEVESWPGVGSRDSITYYSGRSYQRNFVAWMEGVGYDIELGESPNLTARVLWRIAPQTASSCRFSIEVIPYLKADLEDAQKARYWAAWRSPALLGLRRERRLLDYNGPRRRRINLSKPVIFRVKAQDSVYRDIMSTPVIATTTAELDAQYNARALCRNSVRSCVGGGQRADDERICLYARRCLRESFRGARYLSSAGGGPAPIRCSLTVVIGAPVTNRGSVSRPCLCRRGATTSFRIRPLPRSLDG